MPRLSRGKACKKCGADSWYFYGTSKKSQCAPCSLRTANLRLHQGRTHPKSGWENAATNKAVRSPTLADIAWAAGIFEGEGTAIYSKAAYSTSLYVGQKDPWLLHRLAEFFGGSIRKIKAKYEFWVWSVHGARARGFGMTIYTWLSPRRKEQVQKALHIVAAA